MVSVARLSAGFALASAFAFCGAANTAVAQSAPVGRSQSACVSDVTQAYIVEKATRASTAGLGMPTVEQQLALRRAQEGYCLKITACLSEPAELKDERLDPSRVFASCLESEVMSQYNAQRR